jgi:hypothetical protein
VLIDILFGTNSVDVVNVKRDQQPRHHCVGEKYEITTITPQNIAYAAVVVSDILTSFLLIHFLTGTVLPLLQTDMEHKGQSV